MSKTATPVYMCNVRYGTISRVNQYLGTFEIGEDGRGRTYLSGRDCSVTVENKKGVIVFTETRPKPMFKVRKGDKVVFSSDDGFFASSWAPLKKYRAAERSVNQGKLARVKIAGTTYVCAAYKVRGLLRRLGKGIETHVSFFSRTPQSVR